LLLAIVNRKGVGAAAVVGTLCSAAVLTLLTWPRYQPDSWEPLVPSWWQLEWLASLGIVLSAPPSIAIYRFSDFFAANEWLRLPAMAILTALEVSVLCVAAYGITAVFDTWRRRV
jgi:hypothetical protein